MLETIYFALLVLVVYTYVGYPIIIIGLSKVFSRKRKVDVNYEPSVTWVIPSYNEESIIAEKIKNLLEIDYPKSKLEVVVITDGSTDKTPDIAKQFEGIRVLHENKRAGKSAAENRAMKFVESEIVVFNDANTTVGSNALRELVKHYADPRVGGVSGAKGIIVEEHDGAESKGEGLYWRYESAIKKADSDVNSLMGAAGELVSFRSELVQDLANDTILDDFMQSFFVLKQGFEMVYEPAARAEETSSTSIDEELKRKVRIAAGGWQSIVRLTFMFNLFERPIQTWMYLSHRVLRWSATAFSLPFLLVLNLLLWNHGNVFQFLAVAQGLFYSIALIAHFARSRRLPGPVLAIYYFCVMNYAVLAGFKRFIFKTQKASWERSARK